MTGVSGVKGLLSDMLLPSEREEQSQGKYRTAAYVRFIAVIPLLYGFTLYCLLSSDIGAQTPVLRSVTLAAWIALATLEIMLNTAMLLVRNIKASRALSIACIVCELTSNEIVIFLTGLAASHALIFIVITAAVYRVWFDYGQGLFGAVYGTALHASAVLLFSTGLLPAPPIRYEATFYPELPGLLAWASMVAVAIGALITFAVINLGMNRMHRMRRQLQENWKRDLDSIERFNEQVMECPDESAVFAETITAVRYATPYHLVALCELASGTLEVRAASGFDRKNVHAVWQGAGGRLPLNNEMLAVPDESGQGCTMYFLSLECSVGNPVYLAVGSLEAGEPDAHRKSMLLNISQGAGDALNILRMLRMEKEKGYRDGLTELYNKRYLQEQLPVMLRNASEAGEPLCVAMFDIDDFKSFNDTYGHPAGDALLKQVALAVASTLRECDSAVRFGGEEFLAVFAGTGREGGAAAAERIRAAVERIDSANRPVSVSGGVAAFPEDAQDGDSLVECADKRLYEAKRVGKNRVLSN